ncbi:hypothetical protein CJ030_MR1G021664 [Morella rubra]|uniref:Reverse transcriptase zinc-binding domain-containing protein n=1 Tax=Morella rubra TaxID=262757 RepID=A0A6A1WND6_9ROSI|nr:hypothetical protein CJ030_MR1G021664 [Morella rubra]
MLDEGNDWNSKLIRSIFPEDTADAILALRIAKVGETDSLFWPLEGLGEFSVKSAHKALVKHRNAAPSSLHFSQWKDLWHLKLHDQLKLLLWKVTWDGIPTKLKVADRIGGRGQLEGDLLCALCGEHLESLHQLLFICPYSRSVWSESPWQFNIALFGLGTVEEWVRIILHPHNSIGTPLEDQHLFQIFAVNAIDLVWGARNQVVHGGKESDPRELSRRVCNLSWEHRAACQKKLSLNKLQTWVTPPVDKTEVNVDVAIRQNFAVIAAIARDFYGKIQGVVTKQIKAARPLEGEAEATKLGLEPSVSSGFWELILEGDSELVVKAIQRWSQLSEWCIHSTVKEMLEVGKGLLSWQVEHVYRGANEMVHHFAR